MRRAAPAGDPANRLERDAGGELQRGGPRDGEGRRGGGEGDRAKVRSATRSRRRRRVRRIERNANRSQSRNHLRCAWAGALQRPPMCTARCSAAATGGRDLPALARSEEKHEAERGVREEGSCGSEDTYRYRATASLCAGQTMVVTATSVLVVEPSGAAHLPPPSTPWSQPPSLRRGGMSGLPAP